MATNNQSDRYGYRPEYWEQYGLSEEEWNAPGQRDRNVRLVTMGEGSLSPEAQLVLNRARKKELKGNLYESLALQGAQMAGGALMELSPQDRENVQRIEELERQQATGRYLSPGQLEQMEREGMGQAGAIAAKEQLAASVGEGGVETLRAARRNKEQQGQMLASEVGRNISAANIQAGKEAKREYDQRLSYESSAMKKRYAEPMAQGAGEMAKLMGLVAGAEPGEDVMSAVDMMTSVIDEDGKRVFGREDVRRHFTRLMGMNSDEERMDFLEALGEPRIFEGRDTPVEPSIEAQATQPSPTEQAKQEEDERTAAQAEAKREKAIADAAPLEELPDTIKTDMGENLKNQEQGNEFRVWFRENYPDLADTLQPPGTRDDQKGLSAEGSHTNSYIQLAWEHEDAGEKFLLWKLNRARAATLPEEYREEEAEEAEDAEGAEGEEGAENEGEGAE